MSEVDGITQTTAAAAGNTTEEHWVGPTLPTVLGDLTALPIPGTDLIFASIEGGFVFPGTVDIEQLKRALALALQKYPHAAGRLQCSPEGIWTVALTNSPIALTVSRAPAELDSTDPAIFEERSPVFVDQVPYGFAPQASDSEPLARIKVTYWPRTHESSLFLSWCHLLGDGHTAFGFLHTLGRFYRAQPPVHVPTFEKFLTPPAPRLERDRVHASLGLVPHLCFDYSPEDFFKMYTTMQMTTERVDLQFSATQLRRMKKAASRAGNARVSTQDALAAYLITVLNRVMPDTPCTQIMNVVDYRGAPPSPGYTPPSHTAAGNLTITHFSPPLPPSTYTSPSPSTPKSPLSSGVPPSPFAKNDTTLGEIAIFVRAGVATTRTDAEYVRRVIALSEELYARSSNAGRLQWWFPYPVSDPASEIDTSKVPAHSRGDSKAKSEAGAKRGMTVAVNNLFKVPFPSISFAPANAPPARSRFYSFDSWSHYLRIWPGNPTRNPSTGLWDANEGSARTFFRVKCGLGERVKEVVRADFQGWNEADEDRVIRARL